MYHEANESHTADPATIEEKTSTMPYSALRDADHAIGPSDIL
jgi:hypothetical protein